MTESELWKTLRVGDKVRVIEFPQEFLAPATLHVETQLAYQYLVRRRSPLTTWMIDEYGFPWVKFQFCGENGRMEYHTMALNHSGLLVVKRKAE